MTAASAMKVASAKKVAAGVSKVQPPDFALRVGIVVDVLSDTQISVNISGAVLTYPYLDTYCPMPGDNVQLLKMNDVWVAIGQSSRSGSSRRIIDAVTVQTTGAIAGPASAETNLAKLALSGIMFTSQEYMIRIQLSVTCSVNTDTWQINVRRDTAVTGALIAFSVDTGSGSPQFAFPWSPTSDGAVSLFFSTVRATGSGNLTANGAINAATMQTWACIEEVGSDEVWRTS